MHRCIKKTIGLLFLAVLGCVLTGLFCTEESPVSIDKLGLGTTSDSIPGGYRVHITSPYYGADYFPGDTVFVEAQVFVDTFGDTQPQFEGIVSFYQNGVAIGSDVSAPYTSLWKTSTVGSYRITAVAQPDLPLPACSAAVMITVRDGFITISQPYGGQVFALGDSIRVVATPVNTANHSVRSVSFFRNQAFLKTDYDAPFEYLWENHDTGYLQLKVIATDQQGSQDSAHVYVYCRDVLKTVYIGNPADGSVFYKGDTVSIDAFYWDSGTHIARIDFYANEKHIGTDAEAPFQYSWYNLSTGVFSLTVRAFNHAGDSAVSGPVTITRKDGFIALISPYDGQYFMPGQTVGVEAVAKGTAFHKIKSVKLYRGKKQIASFLKPPYTYRWENSTEGVYAFKAIAVDTRGKVDTSNSATITVRNTPPAVYLTSPYNGQHYNIGENIVLRASAFDSSGYIASVKFYQGNKLLTTLKKEPFTYTVRNAPEGNYTFTAAATDNFGATTTSSPVIVTIGKEPPPQAHIYNPADNTVFKEGNPVEIYVAVIDSSSSAKNVNIFANGLLLKSCTTRPYSYTWNNAAVGTYTITAEATDNNGEPGIPDSITISVEPNIPSITITSPVNENIYFLNDTVYVKTAITAIASVSYVVFSLDSSGEISRDYTDPYTTAIGRISLGYHYIRATAYARSGEFYESEPIKIQVVSSMNNPPSITIITPRDSSIFASPDTILFQVDALDTDGFIEKVQFYRDTVLLATKTQSPYTYYWINPPKGTFRLNANATDNLGAMGFSGSIRVTVK